MTPLPDFDTLKWLAENNPEGLEQLRQKLSKEIIDNAGSNQPQLESLMFHLEQQLKRCSNPHQRNVLLMRMMRQKLNLLLWVINNPQLTEQAKAKVIPIGRHSS